MSPPPSSPPPKIASVIPIDPDPDPSSNKSASSQRFLWSNLFSESASSNTPSSSPSYLPDGTPVVIAPPSVILRASSSWAGHLLCRFLGEPPSPAKFFSDLNRVWGKHGDISVRRFSSGTFLVYVPSTSTRKWILQTGLWSSGTVSFVVSEWSVNPTLASPPKLTSATTTLTIREIPPQLWSHEAVATIAGGVATLIPGTRASLPLSSLGTATIKAIVPLGSPLPPSVMVKDSNGDSVLVSIDYGRLPHLCSICSSYGHQKHRCPSRQSADKPIPPKLNSEPLENVESVPIIELNSIVMSQKGTIATEQVTESLIPPLAQAPLKVSETPVQNMDLDNMDGEEMALKCISNTHPTSALSSHVASSPSKLTETGKSSAQAPEVIVQNMDLDFAAGERMVSKCLSDTSSAPDTSPPKTDEVRQQHSKLHEESNSPQPTDLISEHSELHLDAGMEVECPSPIVPDLKQLQSPSVDSAPQLETITDALLPVESLGESQILPGVINNSIITDQNLPADVQAKFEFPPPKSADPSLMENSSGDNSHGKLQTTTHSAEKRRSVKERRALKAESRNVVRCTQDKHKFKPRGVVEKRRKKACPELVPQDEDVHECLQEMQSHKDNTLYYEAIDVYKVLRKTEAVTHEEGAT